MIFIYVDVTIGFSKCYMCAQNPVILLLFKLFFWNTDNVF